MAKILVITAEETRELVDMKEAIEAVKHGFFQLFDYRLSLPERGTPAERLPQG